MFRRILPRVGLSAVAALGCVTALALSTPATKPQGPTDAMKHKDLFRSAPPESAKIEWDDRLKPQPIRYAPVGKNAIIEGDIVIGNLSEVRALGKLQLIEAAEQISNIDDPDLRLSPVEKTILRGLAKLPKPEVDAASKARRIAKERVAIGSVLKKALEAESSLLAGDPTAPTDAIRQYREARAKGHKGGGVVSYSVVQVGARFRWPKGIIPYTIDSDVPNAPLIKAAIDHWHEKTDRIFLRPRQNEETYIRFVVGEGCSSAIGRMGGEQLITLTTGCEMPQIIHEIGHAVGFWHEQSRNDRDNFLAIQNNHVDPDMLFNFDLAGAEGQDVGDFDFQSIMLYPPWSFSADGKDTMSPRDPAKGRNWGVGTPGITGLSAGDIAGVAYMYPLPSEPANPKHPAPANPGNP